MRIVGHTRFRDSISRQNAREIMAREKMSAAHALTLAFQIAAAEASMLKARRFNAVPGLFQINRVRSAPYFHFQLLRFLKP